MYAAREPNDLSNRRFGSQHIGAASPLKRMEPRLERRDIWWNMHVFSSFHAKNARQSLSRNVLDSDVRRVFLEALRWSEDAYERDMKGVGAKLSAPSALPNSQILMVDRKMRKVLSIRITVASGSTA